MGRFLYSSLLVRLETHTGTNLLIFFSGHFCGNRSISISTTSKWAALQWLNYSPIPFTTSASFLIIHLMFWVALTMKVKLLQASGASFELLCLISNTHGFYSKPQVRVVSTHMMLLVPMRELDLAPKVLVPHSSCHFWITNWSLLVLSYCLPRYTI